MPELILVLRKCVIDTREKKFSKSDTCNSKKNVKITLANVKELRSDTFQSDVNMKITLIKVK